LLFAIPSLSSLSWCKQGATSPNDSCRHLGLRSVQSACLEMVMMVGEGLGTVVAGVHAVVVAVEWRGRVGGQH
jgi:hypothetical protein